MLGCFAAEMGYKVEVWSRERICELSLSMCGNLPDQDDGLNGLGRALLLALALSGAGGCPIGCGSKNESVTGSLFTDAVTFSVCSGTPAGPLRVGDERPVVVGRVPGGDRDRRRQTRARAPRFPRCRAVIGYDTFTVAVTSVGDGGAGSDAGTPPPDGLAMTTPPISPSVPADPYMPQHGHGASTVPAITAQGVVSSPVAATDFLHGRLLAALPRPDAASAAARPTRSPSTSVGIPDDQLAASALTRSLSRARRLRAQAAVPGSGAWLVVSVVLLL